MAPSDAARAIADELARQLKNHPRFSLLLMPTADVVDGEDVVSFYWLDRDGSGAADRVVRVADYNGQRLDEAASRIISSLSLTA